MGLDSMHFTRSLSCGLVAATLLTGSAPAEDADASLRPFAVHIDLTPKQAWTGYGIYLGKGLVLTAAHVVGHAFFTKPRVEIAGQEYPAKVVKEGSFNDVDLALVSIDEGNLPVSLRLRHMILCQISPFPDEIVAVVTPEETVRSRVMSPYLLPRDTPAKFNTVIRDVANTGNSGSGVFDATKKCLLGIMSRKIQSIRMRQENGRAVSEYHDVAKYFVPASTIAEFMPPDIHF
jgi:S1-C subfamily serine protease